uniref:Uncharacterized protein n=1 Tax=Callithrix jacchus TaxID=9483 RepID=A0A8I3VZV0_CALJA
EGRRTCEEDSLFYLFIYVFETEFRSCAQIGVQRCDPSSPQPPSPSSSNSPVSDSQITGITGICHHAQLGFFFFFFFFFVFLVEMGFHHVGQAGLKLLTSGDLPAPPPKCWDYRHDKMFNLKRNGPGMVAHTYNP